MKIDIYPEKAQYLTGEPIKLILECDEPISENITAQLCITRLQELVYEGTLEVTQGVATQEAFSHGEYTERVITQNVFSHEGNPPWMSEITLDGMDTEFAGFGVLLSIYLNGELLLQGHTAFDVVSDCTKAIRYGFLSDFHTEDGADCEDVSTLRKFHINMVQYYDWSYRHDDLVSKTDIYKDMMGREVDLRTVRNKINACRRFGIKSIGYGAVYAASKQYFEANKECALYTSAGDPLVFIDTFYIMNVAKDCKWRKHIIKEYAKAVSELGFDGIHMDTYGFPKTAYAYDKQRLIKLDEEYPSLIEDAKARLNEITENNYLIFNNVGNWPVTSVAKAPQAAVYIEVWEPYLTYGHIKQVIKDARQSCVDKNPVILAAYLAPFRTDWEDRAAYAAYLLTAAITVNGAYHLLLGEENGVLTQGYYVDHSLMSSSTAQKMRCYYDFIVQYMELFYDASLVDVSMTHIGWDNTEYRCFHEQYSVDGEADKVWLTIRENENRKLISLINLSGNDNKWNQGKDLPIMLHNLKLQVQIDKLVKGIYFASPDCNHGQPQEISYQTLHTDRGYAIVFEVPSLETWSNVWIDF